MINLGMRGRKWNIHCCSFELNQCYRFVSTMYMIVIDLYTVIVQMIANGSEVEAGEFVSY